MTRRYAFLLLLAPSLAFGDALSGFTPTETGTLQDNILNIAECGGTSTSNWVFTWTASATSGAKYNVYVSDLAFSASGTTGCLSQQSTGSHTQQIASGLTTPRAPATGSSFSAASLMTSASVTCTANQTFLYVCVETDVGGTITNGVSGTVTVDLTTPGAPGGVAVGPLDSGLHVTWTAVSDTNMYGYRVYYATALANAESDPHDDVQGSASNSHDVTGLANDTTYQVQVAVLSKGRNPGTRSTAVTGTPAYGYDFWRYYQYKGGAEQGGCAGGEAGLAALLALAPLALRRRKGRNA